MMSKTEFLAIIQRETGFLPGHKRRQVVSHFNTLLANTDNIPDDPEKALRDYLNTTKTTSKIPRPLLLAAVIILSPILISVAAAILILTAALLIIALSVLIILPAIGISLWFDGINIIFKSIPLQVILADKLWQIGFGLMHFAAGIFILALVFLLYSKLIPLILGKAAALHKRITERRAA